MFRFEYIKFVFLKFKLDLSRPWCCVLEIFCLQTDHEERKGGPWLSSLVAEQIKYSDPKYKNNICILLRYELKKLNILNVNNGTQVPKNCVFLLKCFVSDIKLRNYSWPDTNSRDKWSALKRVSG